MYRFVPFLFIFLSFVLYAGPLNKGVLDFITSKWKLNNTQQEYLSQQKVLALSEVETKNSGQEFKLKAAALVPKKCYKAIRVISNFELYSTWISFIKSSSYNPKSRLLTLRADHTLLPYPMIIYIIVDRPTKEGKYPFLFPTGLFDGLKGEFEIKEINNQCVLYAHSYWKGKKTKIPDLIIEVFSETLSKIGGEILMRKI